MNMITDDNSFCSIKDFIEHISKKDNVVGIVEYGGRTNEDMKAGGDYDLTIIFDKPISNNLNGVHFHIAGIPVDCMLLSLEDLSSEEPSNEFLLAHLKCNILYDRDGRVKTIIEKINLTWKNSDKVSDFEINLYRFTFKHIFDKLQHRLSDNLLYSRYFIFSSFSWFLECYARMNNLDVGKPKEHFKHIEKNNVELYKLINELYSSNDLELQFDLLKRCAEIIIKPVGELWKENEVLFHLLPEGVMDEKEQLMVKQMLFE